MSVIDKSVENGVQEYMDLMNRIEELRKQTRSRLQNATPDEHKQLLSLQEDLETIRQELVESVKKNGITRDILDRTARLLSIF